ncbi:MAG: DUF1592 domain-containing protein [Acidobacteria bacterium]|nr:DUF1592 domain-containing protein [Acidobacteriota bacterium]
MRAAIAMLAAACAQAADPKAFLSAYCVQCHGPSAQMADRRFDTLSLPANDPNTLVLLQDIVDKMNLDAMPPRAARQPAAAEKRVFIESLTAAIADGHARITSTGGQTVLRRLNRREYINTVGDLFEMDMSMFDPTAKFPRDQAVGNLDNIGDALVTSGYLLEQYLDAAEQVVEKALREEPRPQPRTWVFNSNFRQQPEIDYAHKAVWNQKFMVLYSTTKSFHEEGAYGPLYQFAEGVPHDGIYEITVRAEAVNRKHPYDPKLFAMDPDAPFRLGLVVGNAKVGALHHSQPIEPKLGEVQLGDNGPEVHKFRVRIDRGYTPRFTFPNGINESRLSFNKILNRYRHLLPEDQRNFTPGIRPARPHLLRYGFLPQIRIHEVRIEGPLVEAWPPRSHQVIVGGAGFSESRAREMLRTFASRAFRRPASKEEVDRLVSIMEKRKQAGAAPFQAFKDALKAALCSPAFLYLSERNAPQRLDSRAIASRLSYFLWSTMPDAELSRLADRGDLVRPEVLLAQMRRMLASPRSHAFVEGFLDSWLNLRGLGDMPPDRDMFGVYYSWDLRAAMRTETQMFFRHLLDQNESIGNFLDSRYTFLNKPLADLYGLNAGISSKDGHVFRKVALEDRRRGGLLGHASVLTVSANGIETSPVTRGVWILENIFGTPPSPPPDNVPPIDPDVRGSKSVREILSKHRETPACMACHTRIDPPGFALESFDPIGVWRSKYPNGAAVDPSGQLGEDEVFQDVVGLKKILVERRQPQFARMLATRLLSYACGRRMEGSDRPAVDALAAELRRRGGGMRDLLELAVTSSIFRSK